MMLSEVIAIAQRIMDVHGNIPAEVRVELPPPPPDDGQVRVNFGRTLSAFNSPLMNVLEEDGIAVFGKLNPGDGRKLLGP